MATTTITSKRAGFLKSKKRRDTLIAFLFIAPWLIGFVFFMGGPIIASLVLSFFSWNLLSPPSFVGVANFSDLLKPNNLFALSLGVTFRYVIISIPLSQVIALSLAILINQRVRFLGVWRTIFYLPAVVSGVAGSVIWLWMYDQQYGVIDNLLKVIGIAGPNWLFSKDLALWSLIIKSLWNVGVPMVVYLAALQGLPQMFYEAADLDGASEWGKFRNLTIPLISPAILFNLVIGTISGIQTFAEPYVMTSGGPVNSTLFLGMHLYQVAFHYLQMGQGSAIAWLMFIIILILTVAQLRLANRWVYYGSE
ncbi:MAG: sugar ABC transporter permease [Chloroflexi bacterium]|nr:sugar ABC transporter permease [Chloroflexota bacterium]